MHSATEKIYRRYNSNVPFASVKTFARKDRYAKLDNDSTLRKSVRRFSRASREQDQLRNRSHYLMTHLLLLPIILAAWSTSIILGQESTKTESHSSKTRKANGYAFVSPNTRENLTIREAITGLSSLDEQRLIDEAALVTCRLHLVSRLERGRKLVGWRGAFNCSSHQGRRDNLALRSFVAGKVRQAKDCSVLSPALVRQGENVCSVRATRKSGYGCSRRRVGFRRARESNSRAPENSNADLRCGSQE